MGSCLITSAGSLSNLSQQDGGCFFESCIFLLKLRNSALGSSNFCLQGFNVRAKAFSLLLVHFTAIATPREGKSQSRDQ